METRGDMRPVSRRRSLGRRIRTGSIGTIAVGGALFLGGTATLITASAHHVSSTTAGTGTKADGSDFVAGSSFTLGTPIMDSALLGAYTIDPARSVVFFLYGPSNPTCTPGQFLKQFTDTPTGTLGAPFTGPVYAGPVTPTVAGTYHWTAQVDFNGKIESGPTACSDEPESLTKAAPKISTAASAGGVLGTSVTDTATLTGAVAPTGKVIFTLYPDSASCASGTGFVYQTPLPGISLSTTAPFKAVSGSYTPTSVGMFEWTATFLGDAGNMAVTSKCGDEPVTISQAGPGITTTASAGGLVPVAVSDSATVTGGSNPTGTVTFTLYPNVASCQAGTGAVAAAMTASLVNGTAKSGSITLTTAGTYQWQAVYSGDANNAKISSVCGAEPVVATAGGGNTVVTPNTGSTGSLTGMTVGGFLLLGGLGVALVGAMAPRRRSVQ